ncbi:hypothetical protein Mapa_015177 [Marchantia paleacea]|nr:hypothetical protein Mapa_015177 [Marchantia paleacea]
MQEEDRRERVSQVSFLIPRRSQSCKMLLTSPKSSISDTSDFSHFFFRERFSFSSLFTVFDIWK